jgi:hypothetical protein
MLVRRARALRHPIGGLALVRPFVLSRAVTYSRTGIATGVTAAGLVYEVAADVPRFDAAGRLIWEGQRSRLNTRGRLIGGAGWTLTAMAATLTGGPGGGSDTASRLDEGATSAVHFVGQATVSFVSGISYSFSAIVKGETCTTCQLSTSSGAFGLNAWQNFNLSSGVLGSGGASSIGPRITSIGNGWYQVSMTAVATASTSGTPLILVMTPDASALRNPTYTGTNRTLLAFWGWCEDAAPFASSAILAASEPNTATRGTDTGIFNLFGSAGTIAFSAVPGQAAPAGVDQTFYSINNGADADRLSIVNVAGGNSVVLRRVVAGAVTDSAAIGTQTPGTLLRGVLTWSGTDAAAKLQGGTWRTQASTSGGFIRGRLGNIIAGSSPLFGTLGWGDLLPRSVTEAEADAIMARIPA